METVNITRTSSIMWDNDSAIKEYKWSPYVHNVCFIYVVTHVG